MEIPALKIRIFAEENALDIGKIAIFFKIVHR